MTAVTQQAAFAMLRTMVREILERPYGRDWSLQGFGMLRLHLPNDARLHVWMPSWANPGVSTIHDHMQWGLTSTIICGNLENRIFRERRTPMRDTRPMHGVILKPGYGTAFKAEPFDTHLELHSRLEYFAGESYHQEPREIHESRPTDGTVTFMQKHPTHDESARVFWPRGEEWVTAEPRPATRLEIDCACEAARHVMDTD